MSTVGPPPPPHPPPPPYGPVPPYPPGAPRAPVRTSPRAVWAMALGILSVVTGFLVIPLICAVMANVLASQAIQEIDATPGLGGRGQAVAGIACATGAMVLWGSVAIVAIIVEGTG